MTEPGLGDTAIQEGMRRMLEERSRLIARGERMIGWKLAFGSPERLQEFELDGPLVGFLPESNVRPSGATISCRGWVNPVAEPEIAVYLGDDVDHPDQIAKSIAGLGAAIELADVDPPPADLVEVLAGNIFHRAVVLGARDISRVGGNVTGLRARITRNHSEIAAPPDLEAQTGNIVSILGHVAGLLLAAGERLGAGEVVIAGSVVPPIRVQPGDQISFELSPLAPIAVHV
jgi:2-keto-4-pentenoate hydratase